MTLKKQGNFDNDHDFITMGNSPSRFHSSDEEDAKAGDNFFTNDT
jgi:hypothetical protein